MPDCECLGSCPYFENGVAKEIDVIAQVRQQEYCKADFSKCARYMVFKAIGEGNVPRDLLPFQVDRAKELIKKNKKLN
ncbi:MAG: hypothetical protein WC374_08930 [Phycisphaerae bacterium]|jgi:hypothetical protein